MRHLSTGVALVSFNWLYRYAVAQGFRIIVTLSTKLHTLMLNIWGKGDVAHNKGLLISSEHRLS